MGQLSNVSRSEATEKIRHIVKGEVAMFHTVDERGQSDVRPMATSGVDQDGTIWFMSRKDSPKNLQLRTNPKAQLTYSVHSRSEYLVLDGVANVLQDQDKTEELWSMFAKTWFPGGKDDPSITLIRFVPTGGHYWDTKHGKMVQLLGMVVGAVTGKETDNGVEGHVRP